jgi:hypothetical protein
MDQNRIVLFPHQFLYFRNEYGCEYIYIVKYEYGADIYSKTNTDRMFYQYETDMNNKVTDSYLLVSQVYNDIIHNGLMSNDRKNIFDHFASFLS